MCLCVFVLCWPKNVVPLSSDRARSLPLRRVKSAATRLAAGSIRRGSSDDVFTATATQIRPATAFGYKNLQQGSPTPSLLRAVSHQRFGVPRSGRNRALEEVGWRSECGRDRRCISSSVLLATYPSTSSGLVIARGRCFENATFMMTRE